MGPVVGGRPEDKMHLALETLEILDLTKLVLDGCNTDFHADFPLGRRVGSFAL